MSWNVQELFNTGTSQVVVIVNDDPEAGQATNHRDADRLARSVIKGATLKHRGYLSDGTATRVYA